MELHLDDKEVLRLTIIKIESYDNGSHDNQTSSIDFAPPEGYAILPEEVGTPETLENYPFGEVTVEDRDGVPTVTSWTPLPIPEPEVPTEREYTADDLLGALLGLEDNPSGGGVIFSRLAALGPELYDALSRTLHRLGLCGEVEA